MTTKLEKENPKVGQYNNHASNKTQVHLAKVCIAMKDHAVSSQDKPVQIYIHCVSRCDDDVRALKPSADTCKRSLRNQRPTLHVPRLRQDLGLLTSSLRQSDQILKSFYCTITG